MNTNFLTPNFFNAKRITPNASCPKFSAPNKLVNCQFVVSQVVVDSQFFNYQSLQPPKFPNSYSSFCSSTARGVTLRRSRTSVSVRLHAVTDLWPDVNSCPLLPVGGWWKKSPSICNRRREANRHRDKREGNNTPLLPNTRAIISLGTFCTGTNYATVTLAYLTPDFPSVSLKFTSNSRRCSKVFSMYSTSRENTGKKKVSR